MLKTTIVGIKKLEKALGVESKRGKRALETSIKIEGSNRLRQLRDEIKKGIPGRHPYAVQLKAITLRTKTGRMRKNRVPLYRLARLLRYQVEYKNNDLQLSFGFVSGGRSPLTGSWKKLVLKHQEGTDVLYTKSRTELGRRFANIGGRLKKRGDPDARFFFLRRTTGRRIDLPARPIIDPFWGAHRSEALRNIQRNFRLKMRGKRI